MIGSMGAFARFRQLDFVPGFSAVARPGNGNPSGPWHGRGRRQVSPNDSDIHPQRRRNGPFIRYPVYSPEEWNGDFYRLRPLPNEAIVSKHRYGAFESTDLDVVLRAKGIRCVVMTGVATNVCVETTARQAFMRDYYVVFTNDCTATYTQADHDATLRNIDHYFGQVVSGEEVIACWQAAAERND